MHIGIIICDGHEKWKPVYRDNCDRCFKRGRSDIQLQYYHAWRGEMPTLKNTRHLTGLIALGSAYMVSECHKIDWMVELSEFYRQIEKTHLKLVAICFSHQLVNKAFGGTVERTESNFVFGSDSVQFKDHILANEMLPCLPKAGTTWKLLESHRDEVRDLPPGAKLLGSSKRCINEVVLVRPNILTFQGHPDLTSDLMMDKIWPATLLKGFLEKEIEMDVRKEMENLDTDMALDFIESFFRS